MVPLVPLVPLVPHHLFNLFCFHLNFFYFLKSWNVFLLILYPVFSSPLFSSRHQCCFLTEALSLSGFPHSIIFIMADWTDCLNFGISVAKQASEVSDTATGLVKNDSSDTRLLPTKQTLTAAVTDSTCFLMKC